MVRVRRFLIPIISLLLAILMAIGVCRIYFHGVYTPAATMELPKRQIVIDPGHGGEDGGAQANGVTEKDVNLAISLALSDLLKEAGFDVILTRTEDVSIYDESAKSLRNKKRSDILKRLQIANDNPNAIMVSVHQNKFSQSKYSGAQMFYGDENVWSKPLAESLQQSFVTLLQPNNTRVIKPITSSVYLINNAKIPAVLCECGFLSNAEEAKSLSDPDYQQKAAFAIYSGILRFYADEEQQQPQ